MNGHRGSIAFFFGCMLAEKGLELVRQSKRARHRQKPQGRLRVFRPARDSNCKRVQSRIGLSVRAEELPADIVECTAFLREVFKIPTIVAIDEVQFLYNPPDGTPPDMEKVRAFIEVLVEGAHTGSRIFLSGLDTNFRGEPFPISAALLLSPVVFKHHLTAICSGCQSELATMTQRLVNGKPASRNEPTIVVKGKESRKVRVSYQPRCAHCHELPD